MTVGRQCYQLVRMKLFSSSAPITLSPNQNR